MSTRRCPASNPVPLGALGAVTVRPTSPAVTQACWARLQGEARRPDPPTEDEQISFLMAEAHGFLLGYRDQLRSLPETPEAFAAQVTVAQVLEFVDQQVRVNGRQHGLNLLHPLGVMVRGLQGRGDP